MTHLGLVRACFLTPPDLAHASTHSARGSAEVVSGVILAAGLSRRMGVPKQLLPYQGTTMLGHILAMCRDSALTQTVLVTTQKVADRLGASELDGVDLVINPCPEEGQSSSLQIGLAHVSPGSLGALVLMCDQPGIGTAVINRLVEDFTKTPSGVLVPLYHGERATPVLLARTFWPHLETLTGDIGARAVVADHPGSLRHVEIGHLGSLKDIDTPEQYEALLEETHG